MAELARVTPKGRWGKAKFTKIDVSSGSFEIEGNQTHGRVKAVHVRLQYLDLILTMTREEVETIHAWILKCEETYRGSTANVVG